MTIAETTHGPVQGRAKDDVLLFAGIPYAAPPTGRNRFRAAQPMEPWRETRAATRFGPAAPQVPSGGLTDSAAVRWDEDCLTLNITTPALDDARRPVLFWIHGGAYRTGQGAIPWYNGARFAASGDIVVVSVNYRLGALGFTDLSRFGADFATSGANGLLDQIRALEWVRDNIERFGGDPAKVTIAGESAGAFAVCSLLASPLADGLYRAAIAQSGGGHHTLPAEAGRLVADRFLDALQVDTIEAAQAADAEALLRAQGAVTEAVGDGARAFELLGVPVAPFYPVEGNRVVPRTPIDAIRAGASRGIPLLTGSNRHETTLWGYADTDNDRLRHLTRRYGAESTLAAYRENRPGARAEDIQIAFTTDQLFRIPAVRMLEARNALPGTPSWMYWFCWESRAFEGRLGATHALEIPFAFDNLDKPGVDIFLGPGDRPQDLASYMHQCWTRFVRDLDPGWEPYDLERRATMKFDVTSELVLDPDGGERQAWEGLR
ncbi:MAG: carboxylesterase/lipase family protein [Pseudomonadales bacterium]